MDLDKNGVVDYREFTYHYIESMIDSNFNKSLREAFENADKNSDGYICKEEIKYLMKYFFGCVDLDQFMNEKDIDLDGKINYQGTLTIFLC